MERIKLNYHYSYPLREYRVGKLLELVRTFHKFVVINKNIKTTYIQPEKFRKALTYLKH